MNYAITSNHPSGSICINLLDHLELRLDLLPSSLHREDEPSPYRKSKPPSHRGGLVEADVDIPRVKFGRVEPAVSFTTSLMAPLVAFFCRVSLALLPPDGKGTDLQIVFSCKLAIKQVAWPWLYKRYRTFFPERASADV